MRAGRVIIGLVSGGILISLGALYQETTYRSFSSVLVGGGIICFLFHDRFCLSPVPAYKPNSGIYQSW